MGRIQQVKRPGDSSAAGAASGSDAPTRNTHSTPGTPRGAVTSAAPAIYAPHPAGLQSGGYLYNDKLEQAGVAVQKWDWPADEGAADAAILIDSIWIVRPERLPLPQRGSYLGLVHYLPSLDPSLSAHEKLALAAAEQSFLSGAAGCIVPSRFMARQLRRRGFRAGAVAIVEPGADRAPALQQPLQVPSGPQLLTVANWTPNKGQARIGRVLAELAEKKNLPFSWTICGAHETDSEYHKELIRELEPRLGSRLIDLGACSRAEVLARLSQSDLLLSYSDFESFGIVCREALAAGLPVMARTCGGIGQALRGSAGAALRMRALNLRHPASEHAAWVSRLGHILEHPAALARLQRAAARVAPSIPGWDHTAKQFSRAIARLCRLARFAGLAGLAGRHQFAGLAGRPPSSSGPKSGYT